MVASVKIVFHFCMRLFKMTAWKNQFSQAGHLTGLHTKIGLFSRVDISSDLNTKIATHLLIPPSPPHTHSSHLPLRSHRPLRPTPTPSISFYVPHPPSPSPFRSPPPISRQRQRWRPRLGRRRRRHRVRVAEAAAEASAASAMVGVAERIHRRRPRGG